MTSLYEKSVQEQEERENIEKNRVKGKIGKKMKTTQLYQFNFDGVLTEERN